MKPSTRSDDLFSLAFVTRAPGYAERLLEILPAIGDAADAAAALDLFRQATRLIGADAGVFLSVIDEDAARPSYRSLLACDPLWAVDYVSSGRREHDPWLRHARDNAEPIRSTELNVRPQEEGFVSASSRLGFASAVIVPAPSMVGTGRVGVLSLGSHNLGYFEGDGYPVFRVLARALAMELHRWLLQTIRTELLTWSRITPAEIELLRREDAGQSSKTIAAALDIETTAVNSRFQRLTAKLGVSDRRSAARIARLYGVL